MYIYMIVNTIDRSIDRIFASFLNYSQFKIIFTILFSSSFEIKLDKNPNSNHVRENIPREGEINRKKNRNVRLIDRSKTRRRLYTFFRVHFQSFRNFPWFSSPRGNRIVKGRPSSAICFDFRFSPSRFPPFQLLLFSPALNLPLHTAEP